MPDKIKTIKVKGSNGEWINYPIGAEAANIGATLDGAATDVQAALTLLNEQQKQSDNNATFTNITNDFDSGNFSTNLANYKPGNFILKSYDGATYAAVLADYNYFYNEGRNDSANINVPHWVAIVLGFSAGQMNSSDTTEGGYTGSAMHTWCKGAATTVIRSAFGTAHTVAHSCLLSNGTYDSRTITHGFSYEWVDGLYAVLPSEAQIYGTKAWSDLGWSTGEANRQLKLFQEKSFMEVLGHNFGQSNASVFNQYSAWLRDIDAHSPGTGFCRAYYNGSASNRRASDMVGRFPLIILK